jgi:hypothetical protein
MEKRRDKLAKSEVTRRSKHNDIKGFYWDKLSHKDMPLYQSGRV